MKEKGIEASRLEAEVLLAFAWRWDRTHLLIFFDEPVPGDVEKRYDDLICRRSRGVPVPYLTGEKEFMSLGFTVNPDVLIPRPETELLVEAVLDYLKGISLPGNELLSFLGNCFWLRHGKTKLSSGRIDCFPIERNLNGSREKILL